MEIKIRREIKKKPKTALLLLAAGSSTRAQTFNKLSRELNGVPLLTHCYNAVKCSNVDHILVVTSKENHQQAINLDLPRPEVSLLNSKSEGLGQSIAHGVRHLNNDFTSIIICLSDTPLVSKFHINLLLDSNKGFNYRGIHRIYDVNNTPGHPVLFNENLFLELSNLKSDDDPKNLVIKNKLLVTKIKVNNLSSTTDLDTESDWVAFEKNHT